MQSKEKKGFYPDVKEGEIDLETIDYDPEAAKSEVARRPMLLTHSFMMSLVVILLFAVMALIIGMVNIGNLPQIDYMLTIVTACDRNQIRWKVHPPCSLGSRAGLCWICLQFRHHYHQCYLPAICSNKRQFG
jgi:hypothetical protein